MEIKHRPYYIRPMYPEDVPQVNEIDREAFPTQWPPPNYRRELQNKLARLIVACDETRVMETPGPETRPGKGASGLITKIRRLFASGRSPDRHLPPSQRHYVVGFAGIWVLANEAHITNIAVRSSCQRRGIGELLLISVTELTAELNAAIITLEVRASNISAQSLYNKYGFNQVGLRHGYYTDNREDAILMSTENITSAAFQARFQQLKREYCWKHGVDYNSLTKATGR